MSYIIKPCNHRTSKCWTGHYPDKPDTLHCGECGMIIKMAKDVRHYTWRDELLEKLHIRKFAENRKPIPWDLPSTCLGETRELIDNIDTGYQFYLKLSDEYYVKTKQEGDYIVVKGYKVNKK